MELDSLPIEVRRLVEAQLASGRYDSLDDLVCEALRVHSEQEAYFESNREEFRSRIAKGVKEAERGELLDGEETMGRIRREMLERRNGG